MDAVSHGPSLIMLDLGLPDIDGIEVITKIRSWSAVPIIVISARTEDSDKIAALDAGADDYLTKPFSVDELLARVRANLRRSSMASSESTEASTFDNGPLHIDYAAGYATKDGRKLSLTPTEYKLLVLLAKNVDKVLTSSPTRYGARAGTAIWRACACSCAPCARRSRQTPLTPR